MNRIFRSLSIPLIVALLLTSLAPAALALDRPGRLKIMSAVVQVWWITEENGNLRGGGAGSGTLISADGLVLTNHHVAVPRFSEFNRLGIALTTRSDRPPQVLYLAEIVADDARLDLSVLRISHDLNLRPIRPSQLNLPFVALGDSDNLDVGDELNIFGYPGIGGDTVTFTRGVVSGFTLDASIEGRAWIKTDTTIAGGNSGGTAVDADGLLVGVPTIAAAGEDTDVVDCRPVNDTNHDGKLDDKDSCVPIGGFLNGLRPVNLAKSLIETARQGVASPGQSNPGGSETAPAPASQPRFFSLQFASGVSESQQPTTLISSLPSGSRQMYIFFDYESMADGMRWEMQVSKDGKDEPDLGLPADGWVGGATGNWWVGWSDTPFADGLYRMRFLVEGRQVAETQIRVGGETPRAPAFANIVFSQDYTSAGEPSESSRLFPEGTKRLYWFFEHQNMAVGAQWGYTWFFEGKATDSATLAWDGPPDGLMRMVLTNDAGMAAGNWRLELTIGDQPAARADLTVAGKQGGGPVFQPFVFSRNVDNKTGKPLDAETSFPAGITAFYAFSDFAGMQNGLKCANRLYLNGAKLMDNAYVWGDEWLPWAGESGTWSNVFSASGNEMPSGEYTLELVVEGQVVQRGSVTIGGAAPASTPAPTPAPTPVSPADGVQVAGVISDADTGRPIAGAFFIVLKPGITVSAFKWTDDEVYTMTKSDRQGVFRLPLPLLRGQCYGIVIAAEGYWTHSEDDACVNQKTADQVELQIQLQKR